LSDLWPQIQSLPDAPGYFVSDNRHYGIVSLSGLAAPESVAALAEGEEFIAWVDPVARTSALLADYRQTAVWLLLLAYSSALILLSIRYRILGALAVVTPPLLASALALSCLVIYGQALSVFHMMALLLVLGIGVDYTLFLRESPKGATDTALAI